MLVIGGGITGAGVARDAAMRGLRVALVERDDFASGTSSRSSRLIHGGVRYLEQGKLRLVFESSRERRTLLRIAPHLVRPLSFVWPVYRGARIARWKLSLALTLYDVLALFRNVGRHERLGARDVLARESRLSASGLLGGARYWDAATDDARLTLSTALSAQQAGATIVNHARVVELVRDGNRIVGARVVDMESGAAVTVRARVVVNATGPWSDHIEAMARAGSPAGVRGSKGVHVSVHRARVGNVSALTLIAPQDGRVMFVLPAGAFTIIGTTDTYDDVSPGEVRASERDVDYLLASANHYFPAAALTRADVVSAWAGLRPLAANGGPGGDPGNASREHAIQETTPGLIRVTGGKLTTYRAMAEEVVDTVTATLAVHATSCRTAHVPLQGGDIGDLAATVEAATRATSDQAVGERLARAYGSAWMAVWALVTDNPALGARITAGRPYLRAELVYGVTHELARTLADLLVRRVPLAFEMPDHGRAVARDVAAVVAPWLAWDEAACARALADYEVDIARMFTIERDASPIRPRLP